MKHRFNVGKNVPFKNSIYAKTAITVCVFLIILFTMVACSASTYSQTNSNNYAKATDAPISATNLYNDCFLGLSEKVGKYTFADCMDYVKGKGYSATIIRPDDKSIGTITIVDENEFYFELRTYPNNADVEVLTMLIYSSKDDNYQGCISDSLHLGPVKYTTYDIDRERRNIEVSSVNEITEFIFAVAPVRIAAYQSNVANAEDIEVTMDLGCEYNGGNLVFTLSTNLPDGTDFLLTFSDGKSVAQDHVTVKNGNGSNAPFSLNGSKIGKGSYKLSVSMTVPIMQSSEVRTIIGNNGEHLFGNLIIQSSSLGNYLDLDYSIEIQSDGSISISTPTISK